MQNSTNIARRMLGTSAIAAALALGLGNVQAQQPAAQDQSAQTQSPNSRHMNDSGQKRGKHWRGHDNSPMPKLNIRDIYDRVEKSGYSDIREIELEKGRWEVKALNAEGQPAKLYVNGDSGEIEHVKQRDSRK